MTFGKWVDIDPEKEKHKYAIFKEIELNGKAIISDSHEKDWWDSTARSIGRDAQKLKMGDEYVILPPLSTHNSNKERIAVISTGKLYRIEEKKLLKSSRFLPIRIDR